jgi:predicted TIM-barrel fold metal-dependent hydrolase
MVLVFPWAIGRLSGASRSLVLVNKDDLSSGARALLGEVYADLGESELFDYHTHLAGIGAGSDCWVNPKMRSLLHPFEWVRMRFYLSAAGVREGAQSDRDFVEHLAALARASPRPSRHLLLAFDHRYGEDGALDLERSSFHVPNDYVWQISQEYPDVFEPCISVHPYRADAIEELERWSEHGVRFVKWLPNAMGIDPASPRCDVFYEHMAAHGMVLLSHTGLEQAVDAERDQELGNPLRLRRALDHGVRVIAAHCASSGSSEDLDHPPERRSSIELFLRMMDEPRYADLLFGEISTLTQINRYPDALGRILERTDLHSRLVNGSDWPLPAMNVLYWVGALVDDGFLGESDAAPLRELYDYDPLVFDLALKRRVHLPGTGTRFPAAVFVRSSSL